MGSILTDGKIILLNIVSFSFTRLKFHWQDECIEKPKESAASRDMPILKILSYMNGNEHFYDSYLVL